MLNLELELKKSTFKFRRTALHLSSLEKRFVQALADVPEFRNGSFLLVPQFLFENTRFDFMCFPSFVLIECQGGLFLPKSAHTNGYRIVESHRKYNRAVMKGHRLLFIDSDNVKRGLFIEELVKFVIREPSFFDLRKVKRLVPSLSPKANYILSISDRFYNPYYRADPYQAVKDLSEGVFKHWLGGVECTYRLTAESPEPFNIWDEL